VDIIINGYSTPAPPELIEHYYKKEYGLTTEEFYNEPANRIHWFLKIKELESIKRQRDSKRD
jgi:monoamine oxidase